MANKANVSVTLRERESSDRLIKRFMNKVKKEKIIEDVLEKKFYVSPSQQRSRDKVRRKKVLQKLRRENSR